MLCFHQSCHWALFGLFYIQLKGLRHFPIELILEGGKKGGIKRRKSSSFFDRFLDIQKEGKQNL
jgi:hypothetical protein